MARRKTLHVPWLSPWGQAFGDRLTSTFLGLFRMFGCTGFISHLPSIHLDTTHHFPVSWLWALVASAPSARIAAWGTARAATRAAASAAARTAALTAIAPASSPAAVPYAAAPAAAPVTTRAAAPKGGCTSRDRAAETCP